MLEALLLFGAGVLAGVLNALAGGGSFIAFPALLAAGIPPVAANATNTFAALPGYVSGAAGFWRHFRPELNRLPGYIAATVIGALLGAELLLHISNDQFNLTLPWLMALAVVLFAFGAQINALVRRVASSHRRAGLAGAVALFVLLVLVNIYGGFFNGGLGIILLAFLALAGLTEIHAMNGLKLLLSAVVAAIATVRFALGGSIAWIAGSYVFAGTLVGGFVAARIAQYIPVRVLRIAIIIYGTGLTLWFFYAAYWA
ncbi:MAG: sulfite exporter TauE/SafE family protein [Hyphomicrobiaceae bacterium]|nr:sulfite exporter TauE/SafE family protein [Hyphomicrobiaceae bacterium]MCC0024705.1 sulfite exporter TauE/SafE family protein [Hyphomicrobiaceae bacterium]